jgi:hypothetical protein
LLCSFGSSDTAMFPCLTNPETARLPNRELKAEA